MKTLSYEKFVQKLKSYAYDSIEDASAAITDEGSFDKLESLLFIVHYRHGDEINKEEYDELISKRKTELESIVEYILSENDGSDIFGYDKDDDTHSVDD